MPSPATRQTIQTTIESARRRLSEVPFKPATREASLLLGHVLGRSEVEMLSHGEAEISPADQETFGRLLERRLEGVPFAYLVGEREFFGRSFRVDPRALIPRPETEHLVEAVLELDLGQAPRVLDVGTGSGCVALTIALENAKARIIGTDISPAALALAAENRARFELQSRVGLVAGDLLAGLDASFEVVVANLPYIDPKDRWALSPEIERFEPHGALFAPERGTGLVRRLLERLGAESTSPHVLLEIGFGQEETVRSLADSSAFEVERVISDYSGISRIVHLRRPLD